MCSNDCLFCADNTDKNASCGMTISVEMYGRILDLLRQQKTKVDNIYFTGGKPTLREEFPLMIEMARNVANNLHMASNGTYSDPELVALHLKEKGLSHVSFSLNGPNRIIHEAATRTPGSFDMIVNSIKAFLQQGFHVSINCTVTALNIDCLPEMVRFLSDSFDKLEMLTFSRYQRFGEACGHDTELIFDALKHKESISRVIDTVTNCEFRLFFRNFPFCLDNRLPNMNQDVDDVYVLLWRNPDEYIFKKKESKKIRTDQCSGCNEVGCLGFSFYFKDVDKYQLWKRKYCWHSL